MFKVAVTSPLRADAGVTPPSWDSTEITFRAMVIYNTRIPGRAVLVTPESPMSERKRRELMRPLGVSQSQHRRALKQRRAPLAGVVVNANPRPLGETSPEFLMPSRGKS